MRKMNIVIALLILVCATQLQAQSTGVLADETFKAYVTPSTELGQASRTYEQNTENPPRPADPVVTYSYRDLQLSLPKLDSKIKVPMIKPDPEKPLLSNYVRAGFGNYTAPYFEAFFGSKRSNNYQYGVHLKHLSYKNGAMNYSGNSENLVELKGKYFGKSYVADGELGYQRLRYNYYGYKQDIALSEDSIKQFYQTFRAKVGIGSKAQDGKFVYKLDGQLYLFSDNFKSKENEYQANLFLSSKINEQVKVDVTNNFSFSQLEQDTASRQRIWNNFAPVVHYYKDKLHLKGGLNIAYSNDTLAGSDGARVYPVLYGEYKLIPEKVSVFGSLDGGLDKNLLRSFVAQNPWVAPGVELAHSNRRLTFAAGLNGRVKNSLQWKAQFDYSSFSNLYFFTNSASDSAKFTALYDTARTGVTHLLGDLLFDQGKAFRGGVKAEYFHYKTGGLAEAWHRPSGQITLYGSYNLNRKIYFDANLYYISGITGKNLATNQVTKLKPITDLSLKVEYKVSDRISGFIAFNNLLNNKYQRYLNYQVRGLNLMAGATVIF